MDSDKITIIKGDTLSLTINIDGIALETIDKVYFTSSQQNINQKLIFQDDKYILNIEPDVTSKFSETVCDYDITIVFKNGETYTSIYRASLVVLPKVNHL